MPFFKVCRAFPELDQLGNRECQRLARRARQRAAFGPGWGCVPVFIVTYIALNFPAVILFMVLGGPHPAQGSRANDIYMIVMAAIPVAALCIAMLYRNRVSRRAMRQQLILTTCRNCGRSLLGAARSADHARCDSCGTVHSFKSMGIESEDLGPPLFAFGPRSRCPRCDYAIGGLPVLGGIITCPECGEKTAVVVDGPPPEGAR